MCSHYQALKERERFFKAFGIYPPQDPGKYDVWPGYAATFIRHAESPGTQVGPGVTPEAVAGVFGLVPHWSVDTKIARHTYNARSESVATKPSFRDAWRRGQRCIVPVDALYEPDWRSGRAIPTRIARADGAPMGIAGLWSRWQSRSGEVLNSFTMLTVHAGTHPLMRQFHKPADEKRMVVILPEVDYDNWLTTSVDHQSRFLLTYPSEKLSASH